MINIDLSEGIVCKDCKESYFNKLEIIDFNDIYDSQSFVYISKISR